MGGHLVQSSLEAQPQAYRWFLLMALCLIGFITIGTRATLGNFFKTIIADLSWDRGTISFVVAVNLWISGLLQPFTGHLMDRFGAKWLFTVSVAACGLGIVLMSLTNSFGYLLVIYGIMLGAASAGSSMSLSNALLAQWFRDGRAFAMSINNACGAIGQLVLVYVSYLLLESVGWRPSHLYLGIAVLAVAVPMALMVPRRGPDSTGASGAAARQQAVQGPLETTSWSKAL